MKDQDVKRRCEAAAMQTLTPQPAMRFLQRPSRHTRHSRGQAFRPDVWGELIEKVKRRRGWCRLEDLNPDPLITNQMLYQLS